jgi:NAD+ kinase
LKIGFHALAFNKIPAGRIQEIVTDFQRAGFEIGFSASLLKVLDKSILQKISHFEFGPADDIRNFKALLSLGGDGTLLDTLLMAAPNQVPMLSIQFGRLGFLPNTSVENLKELAHQLFHGQVGTQERSLVELETEEENPFQGANFALNEISLTKRDTASMITIATSLNGQFLNEYWGDGLIVSTATGSTGYSLSCGGPILWPETNGLVLTPVSPHNLSMRPIVLPADSILELVPKGRQQKVMLSMDSRSKAVTMNQRIRIKLSANKARFLQFGNDSFSNVLREKLYWGKDLRN